MSHGIIEPAITGEDKLLDALSGPWSDYNALSHQKESLVKLCPPSLNPYIKIKDSDILAIEYLQLHIRIRKRYLERGINYWL